ncbi:MAG: hypothetical protein IJA69_04795, partial [Clostridia bacterium]|nr:hypothetical protein [Clostridia bacterium]
MYNNKQNAKISTSYSFSRITNSKTTQMNFSGVDEWGEYLNQGTIENCYYYDGVLGDTESPVEESYNISAKRIYSVNVEEIFYGFGFESYQKNNSIWTLKSTGPELISANAQTTSLRYKLTDAQGNIVYPYADGYEYGSSINPIIIRTAKEYNEVLGNSKRTPVQNNYNATEVFGSYRLVNNIDLSSLSSQTAQELGATDYKLTSSKMILTGKYSANGQGEHAGRFDGNGLTISNFALADTATISAENFGLFAKVESNAIVMNLNVIIGAQNSEGVVFGIEAKNIENVGAIAGSVENANIVNVNVSSTYQNTSEVIVRGKNIVGGIVGKVSGESYLSNLTAKDISVRAVMNLSTANISSLNGNALLEFNKYTRMGSNANVSYAGGVVGVLDYYTEETINNYSFSSIYVTNDPNFIRLTAQGVMKISASTSGGVIGLVGPLTLVQDIKIQLAKVEDDLTQSISSYGAFAGGLVGYNLGYLRQVRAEHEQAYQEEIESNVNSYYTSSKEERQGIDRGNLDLFNNQEYTSFAVGGLVGVMRSGKIEKAYSKLNVINNYSQYAGGVIGLVVDNVVSVGGQNDADVLDASFEEVYAFGDVLAQKAGAYTGGILGAIVSGDGSTVEGTSLEKVNAVNYWGDWLLDRIDVGNSVGDN